MFIWTSERVAKSMSLVFSGRNICFWHAKNRASMGERKRRNEREMGMRVESLNLQIEKKKHSSVIVLIEQQVLLFIKADSCPTFVFQKVSVIIFFSIIIIIKYHLLNIYCVPSTTLRVSSYWFITMIPCYICNFITFILLTEFQRELNCLYTALYLIKDFRDNIKLSRYNNNNKNNKYWTVPVFSIVLHILSHLKLITAK